MNLRYLAALSTTVGTIVGGGILALPYAVERSGILVGLLLFVVIGAASILITMYTGELSSRFKKFHQLPVMVGGYMGRKFRMLTLLFQILTIYGAQIAYLIGISIVLVALFDVPYYIALTLVFLLTLPLIYKGYKLVEDAETPLLFIKLGLIVAVSIIILTTFHVGNISLFNNGNIFGPFGVILFSLTGYTIIPEVREELGNKPKDLNSVIISAYVISIAMYVLFTLAFIGAFGSGVAEIATNSITSNGYQLLLAITTLFLLITPYIALSLVLTDAFSYDFKINRGVSLAMAAVIPFAIAFLDLDFQAVLSITGGIFVSALSILILAAVHLARKRERATPKYYVRGGEVAIVFTGIIMALGVVYTLLQVI